MGKQLEQLTDKLIRFIEEQKIIFYSHGHGRRSHKPLPKRNGFIAGDR